MQIALVAFLTMLSVAAAFAQSRISTGPRAELGLGFLWTGSASYGSRDANETTPSGSSRPLFSTSNSLGKGVGLEGHLAVRLSAKLRAEVTGTWSLADLRSDVSGDSEGAAPTASTLRISLFTVEGSGLWCFARRGKLQPFVRGGVGWLRELTSDNSLTGDGVIANAGGGVKYWWRERDRGLFKRFGLSSELRLAVRSGGLTLGPKTHLVAPAATAGAIMGF